MTYDEQIAIIQAAKEGKKIQQRDIFHSLMLSPWKDVLEDEPFNFLYCEYRIKPEKRIRPYTFKEMCEAVKKHGGYVINKDRTALNHINVADTRGVFENHHTDSICEYDKLLKSFVWLDDNSPCGIEEEE